MFKTISLLLLVVAVSLAQEDPHGTATQQCPGANEEVACRTEDQFCKKHGHHKNKGTNQPCTKGCYCIAGYLRNKQGKCVTKSECHRHKRSAEDDTYTVELSTTEGNNTVTLPLINPFSITINLKGGGGRGGRNFTKPHH